MDIHWGKHHLTYVNNLNNQISGKDLDSKSLEDVRSPPQCLSLLSTFTPCTIKRRGDCLVQIIAASWNNGNPTPEFNNAAQIFNHEFYWESMSPNGGGKHSPLNNLKVFENPFPVLEHLLTFVQID